MHSVLISGLGAKGFDDAVKNLCIWDARVSRQFEEKNWKPWASTNAKGICCVEMSNRMLTPSYLCLNDEQIPLPQSLGNVAKDLVRNGSHKYLQDNQVQLYEHIRMVSSDK